MLVISLHAANGQPVATRLVEVSPFTSAPGLSTAIGAPDPRVDFCAVMDVAGNRRFGLRDHTSKKFLGWIRLHESTHDFTIVAYDSATESLTVESHGVMSRVALDTATVIPGQFASTTTPATEPSNGQVANAEVAPTNPLAKLTPEERRAHIQQIIERERATAREHTKADAEAAAMVVNAAERKE